LLGLACAERRSLGPFSIIYFDLLLYAGNFPLAGLGPGAGVAAGERARFGAVAAIGGWPGRVKVGYEAACAIQDRGPARKGALGKSKKR